MTKDSNNDIEIRNLASKDIYELSSRLDPDDWKKLMDVIPVECKEGNKKKYTSEHIMLIETAGERQNRSRTEILLEEWGTSGRCRPTVSVLFHCLEKAGLFLAAKYVAEEILKEPPPPRPSEGIAREITDPLIPSAPPKLPSSTFQEDSIQELEPNFQGVVEIPYSQLEAVSDCFAEKRELGGGAWGRVYYATLPHLGFVAIKKRSPSGPSVPIQFDTNKQFHNEVNSVAQLSHPNLLPLLGYSEDGPALCLVYKFMCNGSLLDRLACKNFSSPLEWRKRLEIGLGTAKGLYHLHTALGHPLVHRDVKSANILLDNNFVPKVGDFGLVRSGSNANHTCTAALTTNVIGTSAYMAPEAHRGDVSVKMDVFSFGVVLYELLTGLQPYDETREGHDLITYVDGSDDPNLLVDKSAGNWPQDVIENMFELAKTCHSYKKKRPFMSTVMEKLETFII